MRVVTLLLNMTLALSAFNIEAAEQGEERLVESLQRVFPDIEITSVNSTPIENIYEVMIGPDVIYTTGDGRFILKGDLIDMKERRNLSEDLRSRFRANSLKNISESEYIEFTSKDSKDTIYVFTDIDCAYCRKLHRDVPELNDNAITVRYLAYPREGIGSSVHRRMGYIWCAEDRQQALTDAKSGRSVEANNCENPVETQHTLGRKLGVRGTPAIFLENGRVLSGYMPPDELLRVLGR